MSITGTAYTRVETNVRITSFKLSSTNNATIVYDEFSANTLSTYLRFSGNTENSAIFDVEVTNFGTSEVGILNIPVTMPNGLTYELIGYNLEDKICDTTGKCTLGAKKIFQIKFSGISGEYEVNLELNFKRFLEVKYTNINIDTSYPTSVIEGGKLVVDFKESLKNVSILSNGNEIKKYAEITPGKYTILDVVTDNIEIKQAKSILTVVSGNLQTVGSEICIDKECFYLVKSDTTSVTLLSKYNLYVGGQYNTSNGSYIEYADIATGIQNYNMLAYTESSTIRKGTIAYSLSGSSYSGSIVQTHVNNYSNYLETLGATIISAKLIEKEELESLGCSGTSCTNAPSWVYSTSYWTGTSYDTSNIYYVVTNGFFSKTTYNNNYGYGVRPLIKVSLDESEQSDSNIKVVTGNLETVGSEVCIGDECFYIMSNTSDTITMLSKYNLYLGGIYSGSTYTSFGAGATGIQNGSMVGYTPGLDNRFGVINYSASNYWVSGGTLNSKYGTNYPSYVYDTNTLFYNDIENYKNYLISLGTTIIEARLIELDELITLGCNISTNTCSAAPAWVSSTSYWTGSAYNNASLWNVLKDIKTISFNAYTTNSTFGVRPVIVAKKP